MQPTILVHGYNFDSSKPGPDNPHDTVYPWWTCHLADSRKVTEFSYYSAGGSKWRTLPRAWAAGYRNTYRWAYSDLAVTAAERLTTLARNIGPCNVIGHSLGTRVVLLAAMRGAPFERALLLSGAEMTSVARIVAEQTETHYLNALSRTDDVINLMAENFTPGGRGSAIGHDGVVGLLNWRNVVLDNAETKTWARQYRDWILRGDDPEDFADHHASYQWDGNWDLYNAFLDGDDLNGLPDKAPGLHN